MSSTEQINKVNIRPGVSVLSILRHLNYRPWFALAEFVDNALESFLRHRETLSRQPGGTEPLVVSISIGGSDGGRISIRDNAAGIHISDFPRAFRPAQLPPERTGFAEFGMGMKSAACWFSPRWHVRTSALGDSVERTVRFDINRIVRDEIEELAIEVAPTAKGAHFTEVVLTDLFQMPAARTLGKIKDHLRDIYRVFTREGILTLRVNEEALAYEEPEVLVAPSYREEGGAPILWRRDLDFDFGGGLRAHGFAAIRRVASTSRAGFALFRRRRLIQGSGDEGYRPEAIFGKPNSFVFQRVFGELHLEGFDVSHTKDGFRWNENEEVFLECLREELTKDAFPLLQQAREYRVAARRQELRAGAEVATERTASAIHDHVPDVLPGLQGQPAAESVPRQLAAAGTASRRVIDVELLGVPWRIILELTDDPAVGDWLEIADEPGEQPKREDGRRVVVLRLSLVHPFMVRFAGTEPEDIEPLLRVAAALGLAEVAARDTGVRRATTVRRNVNELLRNAFSTP